MISFLIGVVGVLLTIFFIVGIHEFGHFIVARLVGVKVLRFSLGFGKALIRWRDKKGTEYVLAPIPLGGYVKMLDEQEGPVPKDELAFAYNRQPYYKKFLIVAAGPFFNLLFAFFVYWILFTSGFISIAPIIGKVTPNSIAANAGMVPNEEIISIDGTATTSWLNIAIRMLYHVGDKDFLKITTQNISTHKHHNYVLNLFSWKLDDLKPDPLESMGITPFEPVVPPIIGIISADSPAMQSGLKIGDRINTINQVVIKDWMDVVTEVEKHPAQTIVFSIKRKNQIENIPVAIGTEGMFFSPKGYLGIAPNFEIPKYLIKHIQYHPIAALKVAAVRTIDFTYLNLITFAKLITGKVSVKSLGGPISVFGNAGSALNLGIAPFLSFLAFISIAIGVINIIPIPGLDGGHLLFQTIETVMGKPIPVHILNFIYRLGIIFLLIIISQAVINDLLRLT